jgi:tetratricopeptide (TPR) repeat protein
MTVKSRPPGDRTFVVSCIALKKDYSNKDVGGRIGVDSKEVSRRLRKESLDDAAFEQLLAGVEAKPSEVAAATGCFEAMEPDPDLTAEERDVVESVILENARRDRAVLKEMALRSREAPQYDKYPKSVEVEPIRWKAREQIARLKALTIHQRLGAVRFPEFHHWGFVVEAAEESERAASQDLEQAAGWVQAASEIAVRVKGPEWWCNRLKGAVAAYDVNVLRVKGQIKAARAAFGPAEALWNAGADPLQIFDPALLFDLDASLCRDERRFEVSLERIAEALKVGRHRDRYFIKKGFTLEVMGDYEHAVEALLEATPSRQAEPRLWYQQRFNLAVLYTHLGRFSEAAGLVEGVREVALALRDQIFLSRLTWLEGRLAAGQGRPSEALGLLEQARAEFASRKMWFDVSLAVLESSVLLLDQGRTAEVKALTPTLTEAFKSNGIHREALAALQLFQEAVERDTVTTDLARRVLRFLFRARCDQGLRFNAS